LRQAGSAFSFGFPFASLRFSASDFLGDLMRRRTDYLLRLRPWSLAAFGATFIAVVFAATMQEVFTLSFGAKLYFLAFVPAIMAASLSAGAPAGAFAALLTIPIVWWAFMPPHFEFNPLTAADYDGFAVFLLASSLMICFSHLYREALALIRK
jgi:K+-sensing histidine kinase KdpD